MVSSELHRCCPFFLLSAECETALNIQCKKDVRSPPQASILFFMCCFLAGTQCPHCKHELNTTVHHSARIPNRYSVGISTNICCIFFFSGVTFIYLPVSAVHPAVVRSPEKEKIHVGFCENCNTERFTSYGKDVLIWFLYILLCRPFTLNHLTNSTMTPPTDWRRLQHYIFLLNIIWPTREHDNEPKRTASVMKNYSGFSSSLLWSLSSRHKCVFTVRITNVEQISLKCIYRLLVNITTN